MSRNIVGMDGVTMAHHGWPRQDASPKAEAQSPESPEPRVRKPSRRSPGVAGAAPSKRENPFFPRELPKLLEGATLKTLKLPSLKLLSFTRNLVGIGRDRYLENP